jgi:hypothetical protein
MKARIITLKNNVSFHQGLVTKCRSQFLEHMNIANCRVSFLGRKSTSMLPTASQKTVPKDMDLAQFFHEMQRDAIPCCHFVSGSKLCNQLSPPVMMFCRKLSPFTACH